MALSNGAKNENKGSEAETNVVVLDLHAVHDHRDKVGNGEDDNNRDSGL